MSKSKTLPLALFLLLMPIWPNFLIGFQLGAYSSFHQSGALPDVTIVRSEDLEADGESQYNQISQSNTIQSSNPLSYHDVVQVINGNFNRYYAIVTGDLSNLEREDEIEINYLKKSFGKWVVPHDLDSRTISGLRCVNARVDGRSRYTID